MTEQSQIYADIDQQNREAMALAKRMDFENAISLSQKTHQLSTEQNYIKGQAKAIIVRALVHFMQGELPSARTLLMKAQELIDQTGDNILLNNCYSMLGMVYTELGFYNEGLMYLDKAVQLSKNINENILAGDYINLSNAFHKRGMIPQALEFIEKALNIADKQGNEIKQAIIYTNLAELYRKEGDVKNALLNTTISLNLAEKHNQIHIIVSSLNNLAIYHKELNQYSEAIKCHERCIALAKKHNLTAHLTQGIINLIDFYVHTKNYDKAKEYLDKLVEYDPDKIYIGGKRLYYQVQIDYYEAIGDFKSAVQIYKELQEFDENTYEDSLKTKLNLVEMKYEVLADQKADEEKK